MTAQCRHSHVAAGGARRRARRQRRWHVPAARQRAGQGAEGGQMVAGCRRRLPTAGACDECPALHAAPCVALAPPQMPQPPRQHRCHHHRRLPRRRAPRNRPRRRPSRPCHSAGRQALVLAARSAPPAAVPGWHAGAGWQPRQTLPGLAQVATAHLTRRRRRRLRCRRRRHHAAARQAHLPAWLTQRGGRRRHQQQPSRRQPLLRLPTLPRRQVK